MHRRKVAFSAFDRRNAAKAADRDGARQDAAIGKDAKDDVEGDIVTSHQDKIGQLRGPSDQGDARACARIKRGCERVDLEKAVSLREAGDGAGAFSERECDWPGIRLHHRDQHEFLAAELGADAHRHVGLDRAGRLRGQPGTGSNHRGHERVKGENRGGRKSG